MTVMLYSVTQVIESMAVYSKLNDLPEDMTSAESLAIFHRLLKTHLFRKSFPTTCWTST